MNQALQLLQKKIKSQRKTESSRLSLKLAQQAELILKQQNVENEEAIFLLCCAANYMNAYVKVSQENHFEHNYYFKHELIQALSKASLKDVSLAKEGNVLLVDCLGFEFSFHQTEIKLLEEKHPLVQKEWSQIRLQPYAQELFKAALELNDNSDIVVLQLKALADPMRLKILDILVDEERCACTFTSELPISQSTLSHHLSVLHKAELIKIEKEGVRSNVSIQKENFKELENRLKKYQF